MSRAPATHLGTAGDGRVCIDDLGLDLHLALGTNLLSPIQCCLDDLLSAVVIHIPDVKQNAGATRHSIKYIGVDVPSPTGRYILLGT